MVVINYKRLISNLFILNVVLIRLSQSQTEANNLINNNSTVYEIEQIGSYVKESELNNMLFDIVLSNLSNLYLFKESQDLHKLKLLKLQVQSQRSSNSDKFVDFNIFFYA